MAPQARHNRTKRERRARRHQQVPIQGSHNTAKRQTGSMSHVATREVQQQNGSTFWMAKTPKKKGKKGLGPCTGREKLSYRATRYFEKPVLGSCELQKNNKHEIICTVWQQMHLVYTSNGTFSVHVPDHPADFYEIKNGQKVLSLHKMDLTVNWRSKYQTVGIHSLGNLGTKVQGPVEFQFPPHWQPAVIRFPVPDGLTSSTTTTAMGIGENWFFLEVCNSWDRCIQVLLELAPKAATLFVPVVHG
eukprot:TRINITY_DN65715_c3_g11_i1.p1 TRINITY_DN65715_c3_g11~~TRINITY_DN65715_c3_g11_i1.p1  ORF type:complete len:278 (+),score=24.79 TRINITY_DN65715_c3_g11_i1:97-834(+)